MSEFLERLKERLTEAQHRAQAAQQKLAIAQNEYQAAMTDFQSWQNAVSVETKREAAETPANPAIPASQQPTRSEGSQADKVREFLAAHPTGMTPRDLWKALDGQMTNRAYLYSILSRLKARGQVMERRGKYFFRPEIGGGTKEQQSLLQ